MNLIFYQEAIYFFREAIEWKIVTVSKISHESDICMVIFVYGGLPGIYNGVNLIGTTARGAI